MKSRSERLKEKREKLQSLRQRRAELGNPEARDLKPLEKPVRNALKYLEGEKDGFDVLHSFDQIKSVEQESEPEESIKGLLGSEYTWEKARSNRKERTDNFIDEDFDVEVEEFGDGVIVGDPEEVDFSQAQKAFLNDDFEVSENPGSEIESTEDMPIQKANDKAERVSRYVEHLAENGQLPEQIQHDLQKYLEDLERNLTLASHMSMAASDMPSSDVMEKLGSEDSGMDVLWQEMFYGLPPEEDRENYKQLTVNTELQPSEALTEELLDLNLTVYKTAIQAAEKQKQPDTTEDDVFVETKNISVESNSIDWNVFEDKYGSTPSEELKDFYETAVTYQNEDQEVTSDLLARLVADVNGLDVEFHNDEKYVADNFGDLKSAVASVDEFDYKLPVMEKKRRLEQIADTVDELEDLYETSVYTVERERKVKK